MTSCPTTASSNTCELSSNPSLSQNKNGPLVGPFLFWPGDRLDENLPVRPEGAAHMNVISTPTNDDQANGNARSNRDTREQALAWFVTHRGLCFAFLKQTLCERAIYWRFAYQ